MHRLTARHEELAIRICIVGAGAIGGYLGTQLARAGHAEVCALARGATLVALREHGWRLRLDDQLLSAPARASDQPGDLGPQDLVVVAVKATALANLVPVLAPLLGPETVVMPAMNGVPWWFCRGIAAFGDEPLRSVDPLGTLSAAIPYEKVVGCVVYCSTSAPEPGLVQHTEGRRLVIGEPSGSTSPRVIRIAEVLAGAGFDVPVSTNVRREIWFKLWGNMTMNPVTAMTGATVDRVLADPLAREFCTRVLREAAAIGERIGCAIEQTPADRHKITAKLGAFRTSMLQDVDAGRPIELDAIVAAVHEIGQRLALPTPDIDALLGLTRVFARTHKLYPGA
jgi:2-dehydropantoate 2-reductase